MTLRFGDSFSHLSLAQFGRKWDVGAPVALGTAYGRLGNFGAELGGGFTILGQGAIGKNLPATPNSGKGFFGQAIRIPTYPTQGYLLINGVFDPAAGGAMHIGTWVGADGSLIIATIQVNNFSTVMDVVATSSAGIISANTSRYVESSFKVHNVSGEVTIRVDGAQVVSFTGNTRRGASNAYSVSNNNYFTRVVCGGWALTTGANSHMSDFYYCDDQGSVNNTFLGDVELFRSDPNGVGDSSGFTPTGAATNWDCVNDTNPDDLTTYVSASVVATEDLHQMTDLPTRVTTIKGLLFNANVDKDDATVREYACLSKEGGTVTELATRQAPGSFVNQQDVQELNPRTGLPWTRAEYNAAHMGYRVKS
jgi:hypothetical protein